MILEERDLIDSVGKDHAEYREKAPVLPPRLASATKMTPSRQGALLSCLTLVRRLVLDFEAVLFAITGEAIQGSAVIVTGTPLKPGVFDRGSTS